ncbi:hypothetical protein D3C80_1009880 [compost metagenome]
MAQMAKDRIGLGGDAHPAQGLGQDLQRRDFHRAHIFALGGGGGADDAVGVLPQLTRQGAKGAEVTPLAGEVAVLEAVMAAQAAKQHGLAGFKANGF